MKKKIKIKEREIISRNTQKKFAIKIFIEPKYLSISYVLGMRFAVNVIFGCKHSPCASSPYGKFPKKKVLEAQ